MQADSKRVTENGLRAGGSGLKTVTIMIILVVIAVVLAVLMVTPWGAGRQAGFSRIDFEKETAAGAAAFQAGDFPKAIVSLEKAIKAEPTNAEALMLLAQSHEAIGDLDKAIPAYEASLKSDPEQPQGFYNLGLIYRFQGKYWAAQEKLESAIFLNQGFAAPRIALGDLFAENGRKEKAVQMYQEVINAAPAGVDLQHVRTKLKAVQ